jgi:hypothetical protein
MTAEQAAQLIAQNDRILAFYDQFAPLLNSVLHDVFPFLAVALSALMGHWLAKAAT